MKLRLLGGALLAVGLVSAIPAHAAERVSIIVGAPSVSFHDDGLSIVHLHPGQRHVYGRPYRHDPYSRHDNPRYCPPPRRHHRGHGWHHGHNRHGHDDGRWHRDRR